MDRETGVQMVQAHKMRLAKSSLFQCACCGLARMPEECAGIRLFQPRKKKWEKNIATYAVCFTCDTVFGDKEKYERVEQYLMKQGFLLDLQGGALEGMRERNPFARGG